MPQTLPQLPAQGRNVHPDHVAERIGIRLPDMFPKLLLVNPLPLMEHQILQNRKFPGGEGNRLPLNRDLPSPCVQSEVSSLHQRVSLDILPAQQGADPGLQFFQIKGFCQVVVRTQVQTRHLVGQTGPGG